jgi:hypothetical protein
MCTWDRQKANINLDKHGIRFEEAATVFSDPEGLDWQDCWHSRYEARFKRLAASREGRILLVVYTIRRVGNGKATIRIISARQAGRKERQAYAGQRY